MLRFLPWKYIVRKAAGRFGVMDPTSWLARVRRFSQPSEVQEPIELLRAGIVFHARGLVNTKAIQHNLDWVWPYWVERQFNPGDPSFVPRAFSFSHINLTHRNWTAVGLPDVPLYPIVDPRGLVTPLHDGWSLDFWLTGEGGNQLLPSKLCDEFVSQEMSQEDSLGVHTVAAYGDQTLESTVGMVVNDDQPTLNINIRASDVGNATLTVAIRPYNPEGIQFIDTISQTENASVWQVNRRTDVCFDRTPDGANVSKYIDGDVIHQSRDAQSPQSVRCDAGMATAAMHYDFRGETSLEINIPLGHQLDVVKPTVKPDLTTTWPAARARAARVSIPAQRMQALTDGAIDTLLMLSADDIVPGPYTYRRFWFRDACLMMNSLLSLGLVNRCRRALESFPAKQTRKGYFQSQEGEWDSNGQVLWIANRFEELTGETLSDRFTSAAGKAVSWIDNKRVHEPGAAHDGLLPPGFSAEHLGTNDYYYWDNFWAVAGLHAATQMFGRRDNVALASKSNKLADELMGAIERSIASVPENKSLGGIPASPYRRIDAGAIGSLVADYPLQLTEGGDDRVIRTIDQLMQRSWYRGGFFQDMIHSGINAYLTLDIAQTLLRAGDPRFRNLIETVAELASPTGQWPEAIHPQTLGGCMGDGQHGWAAAEWIMMVRNCFIREEGDRLIVGSGLFEEWLEANGELTFGPTLTPWGAVSIRILTTIAGVESARPVVTIDGQWRGKPPRIDVAVPGYVKQTNVDPAHAFALQRSGNPQEINASERAVVPFVAR